VTEGKFEKLTRTDALLYGPRKLLLCGFAAAAQPKFKLVLETAGLAEMSLVWVSEEQKTLTLSELIKLPSDTGFGTGSQLPRAVIVAGITQKQLHGLMTVCRASGMQQALWAALTPTSQTWTLQMLLTELQAEQKAMQGKSP
jgi:hypothetical protein